MIKEEEIARYVAKEVNSEERFVAAVLRLLEEGCTIPFISRYRKEATGCMDEVAIETVMKTAEKIREVNKRREAVRASIEEQGKLTEETSVALDRAETMTEIEDIYTPFKPKKRTKAQKAREAGLEPLAKMIMAQGNGDVQTLAGRFVDKKKGMDSEEDAVSGAADIITEWISEDRRTRGKVRASYNKCATLRSKVVKGKEKEAANYRDYFDYEIRLSKCPSHRLLAMRRGENEGVLRVSIGCDDEWCIESLNSLFVKGRGESADIVKGAVKNSYSNYVRPAIETEFANASKEASDEEAIRIFAKNLGQLLMASPLGEKAVVALDPGFRTGCKMVCLSASGGLAWHSVIYPNEPKNDLAGAEKALNAAIDRCGAKAIAIGDGTASRETERFASEVVRKRGDGVEVYVVSESGASIYSASETARAEFPNEDVTVRGAVSIGRRLQDPMAELVKLDPKSIGVGQYQYDVDQKKLKESLDRAVESTVNKVGVNLNTAGTHLLSRVSGLGPSLAKGIVEYREANGLFKDRKELMKVPRLGAKAFEQCAGFLRIRGGKNPLDFTSVHPERYDLVKRMAKDCGASVEEFIGNAGMRKEVDLGKYATGDVGMPTLKDIMAELEKPGLDVRGVLEAFAYDERLREFGDVKVGMVVPGVVENITAFGAFVSIGIHERALLHVSRMNLPRGGSPMDAVRLGEKIEVRVESVDEERKRIGVGME